MKYRKTRVLDNNGKKHRFTIGEIVESLQGVGVKTDEAIKLAGQVEKHFADDKLIEIDKLTEFIRSILEKKYDNSVAERFLLQTSPFVPLSVYDDKKKKAFSSREIAQSLEKLNISLKDSFAIAEEVQQNLRNKGYERISKRELSHQIAHILEAKYGLEMRTKYEASLVRPMQLNVLEPSGEAFPFSRGILSQSLMLVGFNPELSYAYAKQLEDSLWHKNILEITRSDLRSEVQALLLAEAGEKFAERYNLSRLIRHRDEPIIIIIGGAPGVGKSTLARELAYRLGIRRIVSSDAIREALRSLISKQLSPSLHASSYAAWRTTLLPTEDEEKTKPKTKQVIRGFLLQAQQLKPALLGIIERSIKENTSLIIEGVHLIPGILTDSVSNACFVELALVTEDIKAHQRNFLSRDISTSQKRGKEQYLNYFTEIRILNQFIADQAEEEGVAIIDKDDLDESIHIALEHVLNTVLSYEN